MSAPSVGATLRGRHRDDATETRRALGLALATAIALGAGLGSDLVAPRGPVTAGQAIGVVALALAVGVAGALVARTRWVLVVQLVALMVGVELGRRSLLVPSLQLRFDNVYGVISFVITRGLHGILVALPMAAGVALARVLVAAYGGGPTALRRPPLGTALLTAATAALIALIAWPASTPLVTAPGGAPVPGSIAELATVRLGGTDQTILIRAADPTRPVLLYLSGGPGQSDLALSRALSEPWTGDFVFVNLDQRGNGSSYAAIDPVSDLTLDRAVSDVVELTEYLRTRFDERRIYLMGESWGTILGVLAVQRRPDLYHAWIGSGQMVDVLETDRRVYADLVAYALRAGDASLAAKLREIGEPPYRDIPWANSNLLSWYDFLYQPYTPPAASVARREASGLDPFGMLGSEYSFIDKANVLRGLIDTFTVMYPQLYDVDFRKTARRIEVPVYILDGLAELEGRRSVMLDWYAALEAPIKQRIEYADAAHSVAFEEADAVHRLLVDTIVPATYDR